MKLLISKSEEIINVRIVSRFNSATVKLKLVLIIQNCAICDKSIKLSGVLAYGMTFIFRRGGIEFTCGFLIKPFLWSP